jgi:hypothetical protein
MDTLISQKCQENHPGEMTQAFREVDFYHVIARYAVIEEVLRNRRKEKRHYSQNKYDLSRWQEVVRKLF